MNRYGLLFIVFLIFGMVLVGCPGTWIEQSKENKTCTVSLAFQIKINQRVYQDSAWGEPPQMAIWLQNQEDNSIRTVMVTYRTAGCDWDGKVECSVALPYWVGFYNRQTGTTGPPTFEQPAPDAVTFATPIAQFTTNALVSEGSRWLYFVEINVSGDFNVDFPSFSEEGYSDRYGNGQPSIVYKGDIVAVDGAISQPVLLGRTDQYEPVSEVIEDVNGITTAANLLDSITVNCLILPSVQSRENGL
jgi:hypothetical protein